MPATSPVTRPHERSQSNTVGQLLRDWRTARAISQLDLALHAGFSARHVSFIETGRTQPSRQALLVLAESLDDLELRLFCTYMTLGTPQDVTLQELRIETFFPADEASGRTWHERFASFLSPAFSQHST